jgi:3-oxoacyl-[acyl-carrier protein] reductase
MSLEGKLALVTGASMARGIGKAAALALARDGADVVVTGYNNMDGVKAASEEIKALGRKSMALKVNGRDYADVQKAFAEIKKELGPINILVNNMAQMRHFVPMSKITIQDWESDITLCLNSAFYCTKEAWADMVASKYGRIINLTSVAGVMGGSGQAGYAAAKSGLIGFTKSLALEGARSNVTANCVLIGTANTEAYYEPIPEETRLKFEKRIAMRRPAEPEEIADAIAFAVSDKAKYMTGAIVNMMGGLDLFVF